MSDYIKREDAIKAITTSYDEVLSVGDAIEKLDSLPPADVVERKKGKWEPRILPGNFKGKGCSECREIWGDYSSWNFCPNCGVDMRDKKHDI